MLCKNGLWQTVDRCKECITNSYYNFSYCTDSKRSLAPSIDEGSSIVTHQDTEKPPCQPGKTKCGTDNQDLLLCKSGVWTVVATCKVCFDIIRTYERFAHCRGELPFEGPPSIVARQAISPVPHCRNGELKCNSVDQSILICRGNQWEVKERCNRCIMTPPIWKYPKCENTIPSLARSIEETTKIASEEKFQAVCMDGDHQCAEGQSLLACINGYWKFSRRCAECVEESEPGKVHCTRPLASLATRNRLLVSDSINSLSDSLTPGCEGASCHSPEPGQDSLKCHNGSLACSSDLQHLLVCNNNQWSLQQTCNPAGCVNASRVSEAHCSDPLNPETNSTKFKAGAADAKPLCPGQPKGRTFCSGDDWFVLKCNEENKVEIEMTCYPYTHCNVNEKGAYFYW